MSKSLRVLLLAGLAILLSACNSNEFKPSEYISTTGSAQQGEETRIELEDGAAIVVPAHSMQDDLNITVERNPEKINSLPPFGDDVVQLGNFYNFAVEGDLTGAVDLILPYDPEQIPEENGILVAAIPDGDGWKYIPVIPDGNKVTLYTTDVGDPLIMWHFANIDEEADAAWMATAEAAMNSDHERPSVCDPRMALQVVPTDATLDAEFTIVGQVLPVDNRYNFAFADWVDLKPAENISVELVVNMGAYSPGRKFTLLTDEEGKFSVGPMDAESLGLKEGWNWAWADAQCDKWFGKINVPSEGYVEFKIEPPPPIVEETEETEEETVVEEPEEIPISDGAILLPDFVGKSLDEATDWLEKNNFGYTWIDGNSTYDLGMVYDQAPAGGQYKVPHRTIVVLYRTIEQVEIVAEEPEITPTPDPYGCDNPDLTPEERANCGKHTYTTTGCKELLETDWADSVDVCAGFKEGVTYTNITYFPYAYPKITTNTYCFYDYPKADVCGEQVFTSSGYTITDYITDMYDNAFLAVQKDFTIVK